MRAEARLKREVAHVEMNWRAERVHVCCFAAWRPRTARRCSGMPGIQLNLHLWCVFQPNVDARFSRTWTAFQMNVDAISG